jgi:hypothetical protein
MEDSMKPTRLLALCGLLLTGCVARPLYEVRFDTTGSLTWRERWILTLSTRYNCDTTGIKLVPSDAPSGGFSEPRDVGAGPMATGRRSAQGRRAGNPSAGSEPGVPLGQTACQLAGVFPRTIRVWKTDDGIREEWLASMLTYQFEGPDPTHLRLLAATRR